MSDHCQDLVAKADKDRFLACLFAPAEARPHLFALYAFNVEIARIRETVSEPQIGLVRQQWWLDTLDGIYAGRTPDHPVAQALVSAVAKGDLPKHALQNLVIAREFDLYDDPMPSLADLEGYLGETSSSLIQMAALILGKGAPEAAGLAGVAFGLAGVLRLKKSRYLPRDMVQDLVAKLARKPESYDASRPVSTWVFSVAKNMCKNAYRHNEVVRAAANHMRYEPDRVEALDGVGVDHDLFRDRLSMELDRIDPDHKATFVMRYHEDMAIKEIAAAFGCSEGTVKSRLFYTLKKLAERMKEFDPNALHHGKA